MDVDIVLGTRPGLNEQTPVQVEGPVTARQAIQIAHGDRYETLYGHLEETLVAEGQRVRRGDRVGLVGSTGRSTAPHLHYEVHVGGRPVNPLEYILETR